ncbi:TMAO/DMSO reductase [Anatilimnocola aggregata]|uniref:TMAO/DMSO reductase n=1 Tax=Anatilimnocola aggregata TaxID=2528021 RepID=A0A517YHF4_9BACT|nr:molybdopterin-dependent oxidoreductase [Anatilimnocola aggregata]QDU29648.1 TMAO/DMSO reductase [Anatilimnocola aggregata]
MDHDSFLTEHRELTRRFFLQAGALGFAATQLANFGFADEKPTEEKQSPAPVKRTKPEKAGVRPEPYFTPSVDFRDVSRGKPLPHSLPDEKKREVGLTRETWQLEVLADPDNPAKLGRPLTKEAGTALNFEALLKLAEKHAVRFPKVMTCLNLGCPLGMGLWEGVPLRDVIWLTQPRENLRRVFYYGYHNDDPKQMFRSSLPIGRILEDPYDLPPVILCYKLNGEWLDAERGGPVRVVVPEAYGFKSIKWLTHVVLTNLAHANDTYAEQNNDVDSPLKTFAASISVPREAKAGQPIPVSGYAQVGISGLKKVQVWAASEADTLPEGDPYFTKAPWMDAELLPVPKQWSGLNEGKVPPDTHGFDQSGAPKTWPMRLTNTHWAAVLPGLPKGDYIFRCRTIDAQGHAQPMPRPFRKSGHSTIEMVEFKVVD